MSMGTELGVIGFDAAPICVECWNMENPNRPAIVIGEKGKSWETCAICLEGTKSGIYQRRRVVRARRWEVDILVALETEIG